MIPRKSSRSIGGSIFCRLLCLQLFTAFLKCNLALSFSSSPPLPFTPSSDSYVRWQQGTAGWEMQTAVTRFHHVQHRNVTLELHAQLHFGSPEYFQYYNTRNFSTQHDAILYELLVDETLLTKKSHDAQGTLRRLCPTEQGMSPVTASLADQATARRYGWECQATIMDYSQPKWIHADFSRQEFLLRLNTNSRTPDLSFEDNIQPPSEQPLWQQASRKTPNPAVQMATTALIVGGPPFSTVKASSADGSKLSRRLFTNLFLPGTTLANVLRAALWVTVPSPELSILLLDWSSLFLTTTTTSQQKSLGLSPLTVPVWQSLLQGRLDRVRQLIFGQVVLSSNTGVDGRGNDLGDNKNDLLITQRNDHALSVLDQVIHANNQNHKTTQKIALLYGCSHCPDLHSKLHAAGFQPQLTTWRTAWDVPTAPITDSVTSARLLTAGAVTFLLGYLAVSGGDWVATWQSLAKAESSGDLILEASFYIFRHVLFYIGLSKLLLLDWSNNTTGSRDGEGSSAN